MSEWNFSGSNFSNWGTLPGVTSVDVTGPSNKNQVGNSNSKQTGDSTSLQFGNKNSFQQGISNSALMGLSFSTNVAQSVSTLVGVSFSFQMAGSVSAFIGPKFSLNRSVEVVASYANKYTLVNKAPECHVTYKETKAAAERADFITKADEWLGTKSLVAQSVVQNILDGNLNYGQLVTQVTGQCRTTAGSLMYRGGQQCTMSTMGQLSLEGATGITMEGPRVQINGAIINLG